MKGVYSLLKPGGEFYFSDVYSDRRVPESVRNDSVLYGECLGGALYWNDFLRLSTANGFADPRLVDDRPLQVTAPELANKTGSLSFFSATFRLFKLDQLESACEDYGQAVIYLGTVKDQPDTFMLDKHHLIEAGKVFPVCGNTWHMLKSTRFADHFQFIGDFSCHYGIFEGCGSLMPFDNVGATSSGTTNSAACC